MSTPLRGIAKKMVNDPTVSDDLIKAIVNARNNGGSDKFTYDDQEYILNVVSSTSVMNRFMSSPIIKKKNK